MRAGQLRHRVILQTRTVAQNSMGEAVETWSTYATVWARVSPLRTRLSSDEFYHAQQINARLGVEVTIRYLHGVETIERVVYGRRVFDVRHVVDPDERHVELILACEEVKTSD